MSFSAPWSDEALYSMTYVQLRRCASTLNLPSNIKKKYLIQLIKAVQRGDGAAKKAILNDLFEEKARVRRKKFAKQAKDMNKFGIPEQQQIPTDLSLGRGRRFETEFSVVTRFSNTIRDGMDLGYSHMSGGIMTDKLANDSEIVLPRNHTLAAPIRLQPSLSPSSRFHSTPMVSPCESWVPYHTPLSLILPVNPLASRSLFEAVSPPATELRSPEGPDSGSWHKTTALGQHQRSLWRIRDLLGEDELLTPHSSGWLSGNCQQPAEPVLQMSTAEAQTDDADFQVTVDRLVGKPADLDPASQDNPQSHQTVTVQGSVCEGSDEGTGNESWKTETAEGDEGEEGETGGLDGSGGSPAASGGQLPAFTAVFPRRSASSGGECSTPTTASHSSPIMTSGVASRVGQCEAMARSCCRGPAGGGPRAEMLYTFQSEEEHAPPDSTTHPHTVSVTPSSCPFCVVAQAGSSAYPDPNYRLLHCRKHGYMRQYSVLM